MPDGSGMNGAGFRGDEPELPDGRRLYRSGEGRKKRRWLRIVLIACLALLVIVIAAVGGSYLWLSRTVHAANNRLEQLDSQTPGAIKQALSESPPTTVVPITESASAMDILLVGDDSRSAQVDGSGRSDTIIVVHVDPANNYVGVLSIPRDLYVNIPGHGKNKINAAYAYGGAALSIKTIKQLTGVNITKYAEVDLQSFANIINSLGGVYVDVDRAYTGIPAGSVKLSPGYQWLSGQNAVLFSRFRYDSNMDFGRMARQQRILAALREQAMTWNLPLKLPGIVSTVMGNMATNLSANDLLKLGTFVVGLGGQHIRQILITGTTPTIDGMSVVMASDDAIKNAITQLLTPPSSTPQTSAETQPVLLASAGTTPASGLLADTGNGNGFMSAADLNMWKAAQVGVSFPLEAPTYIPAGFSYSGRWPQQSGTYDIKPGDESTACERVMYRYGGRDLYLGVSATSWTGAPLASKGTEVTDNGVVYTIVGTHNRADHIWWKQDGVLYFVSNTLMYSVTQDELLKMAESMQPVSTLK